MTREELKTYQEDVLASLEGARSDGAGRALIDMATGLGKTVISAFDVDAFMREREGKMLLLCHNNAILNQDMCAYAEILGDQYDYGLFNGDEKASDARFLFASFQAMLLHKEEFAKDEFAYVVVDEAHHAPAGTYQKVINYFKPEFLLGMTATPERLDGLDLEDTFGPAIYNLGLAEAIRRGLLVNIDYRLILDEMADLDALLVDGEKLSAGELNRRLFIPKRDEEIARIIAKKKTKGGTMLVFCCSIEHAKIMHDLLPDSAIVHSGRSPEENRMALAAFRSGEVNTIISVDMLNEGVDRPHADTIVFLRSTVSMRIFKQQLGRGLRLHEGKNKVTILDFVANVDRLNIIRRLRSEITNNDLPEDNENFVLSVEARQFHEKKISLETILHKIERVSFGYSKEELIEQVRKLADELGRTPMEREFDEDRRTAGAATVQKRFGSWNAFLREAGLDILRMVNYSDEELIEQIRAMAKKLGRTPTRREYDNNPETASTTTIATRFGSWNKALALAGLNANYEWVAYSKEELIEQVQKMAEELGRTPTIDEFRKNPNTGSNYQVLKFFAEWNDFIRAAGLKVSFNYSKEDLIKQVREYAAELGRTPTSDEFKSCPNTASTGVVKELFGSWNAFLEEAGLTVIRKTGQHFTKEELIAQLLDLRDRLGRTPTRKEFHSDANTTSSWHVAKLFDSWGSFVEAAGLTMYGNYTKEELLEQVRLLAEELGHTPTQKEFDTSTNTASGAYVSKVFGSYNQFLREAGLKIAHIEGYSGTELIRQIRELSNDLGHIPTRKEFEHYPDTCSFGPVKRLFGSWDAFLRAAGLR